MDFKSQDGEIEISPLSSSLVYNPPPIRGSAFSKPILSFSSLPSPRGGDSGSARNGSSLGHAIAPPKPAEAAMSPSSATGDVSSHCTEAKITAKYGECLRNHAAASGSHVVDGCGEFMAGGDSPAPESMRCAACGCHRSFHRKESGVSVSGAARLPALLLPPPPHHQAQKQFSFGAPPLPWAVPPTPVGVMAFSGGTTTESSSEERFKAAGMPAAAAAVGMRKRYRTKFTAEQKEKMLAFAEKVGWRMQRQEEASLEQFCAEVGVTRHVFKVWMHNNKHGNRKPPPQQLQEESLPLLVEVQHHHQQSQ